MACTSFFVKKSASGSEQRTSSSHILLFHIQSMYERA